MRTLVLIVLAAACAGASAQAPRFAFATVAEARAVLGARDDYIAETAPLERSVLLRTPQAVDEAALRRYMADSALEWSEAQRAGLAAPLERLERFAAPMKAALPKRILLLLTNDSPFDGTPHTRANAIVLPARALAMPPQQLDYVLAHELFHVVSRADPAAREKLYAALGFRRCERVEVPAAVAGLRATNPDSPVSRHSIPVRYRGEWVEALPYVRLRSPEVDPRAGLMRSLVVAWLLVERDGGACRARAGDTGVPPGELEGLLEQVGRNTGYLFHPEEILADNFALLYLVAAGLPQPPSPDVLELVRRTLFD